MSVFGPQPSSLDRAVALQELLVACATGSGGKEADADYVALRREVLDHLGSRNFVPDFVRTCRTLSTFWSWIKGQAPTYERRRLIIRQAFQPLLDALEMVDGAPSDLAISEALESFDGEGVHRAWAKALDRRSSDPEGAITMSRTLLETVSKRILDASDTPYSDNDDLPKLYHAAAELLTLAPNQHTQPVFKAILGSCQNIVNSLGTLRNKIGDAHGQRGRPVRPSARHAALAVNLAGTVATFLIETYSAQQGQRALLPNLATAEGGASKQPSGQEKPSWKDPTILEEIRQRLPISTVVGKRVKLKKTGREWKGLSPFVPEKAPSFVVNDQKGFYHCFSTGKHGDIFGFLMETEGISFREAFARLASEADLPLRESKSPERQ
jgi:CHC2-type zinc finger protein/abortive infection Abi-like protein